MLIAVCDDEKIIREKLTDALYGFFGRLDLTCKEYADGEELLSDIKKGVRPEALFLDIEMPVLDGMSTAVKLRELDIDIPVIFLTSHTEMAMDGYEVAAFRFLGKPVDEDKLYKTLSDLKEKLIGGKHIVIRYEGEDVVVPVDDIVYIEAQNNSIRIVLSKREYTIRGKLADIKKQLSLITDSFYRIHRGYVVNLRHVKKHHSNEVIVSKDTALPLSRSSMADFKIKLLEYVRNSAR